MRRTLQWIGWGTAALAAVVVGLVLIALIGANTQPGRTIVARLAPRLTGGLVTIDGLSGRFPDRLNAARVSLHDRDGVWATVDDFDLDWSPLRLVVGDIAIRRLAAMRITVLRRPAPSGGSSSGLPLAIDIASLHVGRLELAPAVAGTAASLSLDGAAGIGASGEGHAVLIAKGIGAPGNYRLDADLGATELHLRMAGQEPAHGLISETAGLPDVGPLSIDGTFAGPRSAVSGELRLVVGPARLSAYGKLDLEHRSADLVATGAAPAMAPRPDLSWRSIAFDARIDGPFARPAVSAKLDVAALRAVGATVADIAGRVEGDAGTVRLRGELSGIRIPGPHPDLLAAAPVRIAAEARLDEADRPVHFSLAHPLVEADGDVRVGQQRGALRVTLPDLAPLATLSGLDLDGHAVVNLSAAMRADTIRLDAGGTVGITGGTAPAPALIGDAARLTLSASATGPDVTISRFAFDGRMLAASAAGRIGGKGLALDWELALPDLRSAVPTLAGGLRLRGRVSGPTDDLAATADLSGALGPAGGPAGPVVAAAELAGLPEKPKGRVTAQGVVLGSPLRLALAAMRTGDGTLRLTVEQADWKSAHAQGSFVVPAGTRFPLGRAEFRMTRLDDLRPLIGRPVTGTLAAGLTTAETGGRQRVDSRVTAGNLGLAGAGSDGHIELTATVSDPLSDPVLDARISTAAKSASGISGAARIELAGPEQALGLRVQSEIRDPKGGNVRVTTVGTVNAVSRVAALSRLEAVWKDVDLHLLAPARVGFGDGIRLDHLRLGIRQATIEANGRVSPTLDLTVALRNFSADMAAAFVPGVAADGMLRGDARLTGTPQHPRGRVALAVAGLRLRKGPGRALPAANFSASADLEGTSARLDAHLTAGPAASLSVRGQLSTMASGPIDLRAAGALDLAMLDPLLTASGRRVTGKIALDGGVGGTLQAPRISGTARLTDAAIDDFGLGVHLTGISGLAEAAGTSVRLTRLQARAGPGTIAVDGTIGFLASGIPVDLRVTARNARPLATDLLTAALNADMNVRGEALGRPTVGGRVDVLHAEIGIPKRMPAQVPVLEVRIAGAPPPAPPAPPPAVNLDLTVAAQHVVVRGRGLFAELAGSVKVTGSSAAPQPLGSFQMVRGNLGIAGQTLTFNTGEVGFNGGSLTDPSLNFLVNSQTATMNASLAITGTASHPKVTVTSIPEMPQDQALARILYPNNASPSPLQLAAIANSLAELSGVTSGGGVLGGIQNRLGLEQLSIGATASGSAALEVGRYVAPGVYVGAQQGAGGNSSQAKVEIDIAKGLKVVGTVGNGTNTTPGATPAQSAGTSLGVKYQFEY